MNSLSLFFQKLKLTVVSFRKVAAEEDTNLQIYINK